MLLKYLIQKIAQDNVPEIEKGSCLHYRNTQVECNICLEACPTTAIVKKSSKLIVDDELCIGCGICKVKCPGQSIQMKHFGEHKIPKAIENNVVVVFGCNYADAEGNVILPCLNGLHPELLAALFLYYQEKTLLFNLSKCQPCSIDSKSTTFEASLQKVIKFIEAMGVIGSYQIIKEENEVPEITPRSISRRELFNIFKEGSVEHATEMVNSVWGEVTDTTLNHREKLLNSIKLLIKGNDLKIDKETSLLTSYQVNSKCDGCSYCKAICPSKAWQVEEIEDTYTLSHSVAKCRSCQQCIESCHQKAIEKENLTFSTFEGFKVKIVKTRAKCKKCNSIYIKNKEDNYLCRPCLKREELRKSLFNKS